METPSVTFEELHLALMLFRLLARIKRAEVFTFFRLGINFPRVQSVLT
jgi:hypothetical protein